MTNLTTVETANVAITENQTQIVKVLIEKLDGGFISNATGRRAIHKDAYSVADALGIEDMIKAMPNEEYHLDVVFTPKNIYKEYEDLIALALDKEELTLESAKELGIIESGEVFNPYKVNPVDIQDTQGPIKIDAKNCYGPSRLKAIDWKSLKEQVDMPISELAGIAGLNKQTFYNTWANIMLGKYTYQRVEIRIGLTILAKYFEKTLDVRTSTKEQCEKMKDDLNKMIRELEIMGSGKSHIKTSDVQKKLIEMRKVIL